MENLTGKTAYLLHNFFRANGKLRYGSGTPCKIVIESEPYLLVLFDGEKDLQQFPSTFLTLSISDCKPIKI